MDDAKAELLKLMDKARAMELEIAEICDDLNAPLPTGGIAPGLRGPLVDSDGFPRNDVDVYQVRLKRQRVAILQTDHVSAMKLIEGLLVDVHAASRHTGVAAKERAEMKADKAFAEAVSRESTDGSEKVAEHSAIPFASIDSVAAGGPADIAGLRVGDRVVEFASVRSHNHNKLQALGEIVRSSEGRAIRVVVVRESGLDSERIELALVPQAWIGAGLLGCHLLPL